MFSLSAWGNPTADYFARFKYDLDGALEVLKKADGKPMADAHDARNLLDDLGYWSVVRNDTTLKFTPELQAKIEAQYKYLKKAFTYEVGDLVWVTAESPAEKPYGIGQVNHRAQIADHMVIDGTDLYKVDVYVDGSAKMVQRQGTLYDGRKGTIVYYGPGYQLEKITKVLTRAELDKVNSPASSLPKDNMGEVLDWAGDKVWRDKLEDFKSKLAKTNFEIDFRKSPAEIEAKQQELMLEIFRHFKMNRNAPSNSGKGIGLRACGGGVCFDQALVLAYAVQAVGQTSGIKALNLNGTTVNPMGGHGFVRYDLKTNPQAITFDKVFSYDLWEAEFAKRQKIVKDGGVPQLDFEFPEGKATYEGVKVKTSTWIGISDPGWADYGITPDFFARVPFVKALNPIPIDSNRAVNGLSSQRNLSDVAQQLQAKGPLNTHVPQKLITLDQNLRKSLLEEWEQKKKNLPAAICKGAFD
jgi:hypothetical protein